MNNSYVVSLLSQAATEVSFFGAKTANLAKAVQSGFAVPDGLAVSRLCTKSEFDSIAQKIIDNLSPPIAVRSSAVKEDSVDKAFAGVFETYLGIRTVTDLMDTFLMVKNSGATDLVKKYHGDVIQSEQIAVLIQRMVDATRAGVAFSCDPVTGESKVIIESSYGLGKSVVDGNVTPDSIDYFNDGTYKTFIGRKSIQIMLTDSGTNEQNTPAIDSVKCSLTEKEIKEIAELARQVESKLGFKADIEWAIDPDGVLWLLQARPITTIIN